MKSCLIYEVCTVLLIYFTAAISVHLLFILSSIDTSVEENLM
jgi:hypothetical protein